MSHIVKTTKEELRQIKDAYVKAFDDERNPIELVTLFYYTGKSLNNIKRKKHWILFTPYLNDLINYLSEKFELINKEDLKSHILSISQRHNDLTFKSFLLKIEKYVKLIYQKEILKNHDLYISTKLYINLEKYKKYYEDFQLLNIQNIIDFFVYYEHKEDIARFIIHSYSQYICCEEILEIFELCKESNKASMFSSEIQAIIYENSKRSKNPDIDELVKNICINVLDTSYKSLHLINDEIKEIYDFLDKDIPRKQTSNYIQVNNMICRVESDIIQKVKERIKELEMTFDLKEMEPFKELEEMFKEICLEEIRKNRLNISDFVENMLFDIYDTKLDILKLELIED